MLQINHTASHEQVGLSSALQKKQTLLVVITVNFMQVCNEEVYKQTMNKLMCLKHLKKGRYCYYT